MKYEDLIIGDWESGGFAPWQAMCPIQYCGIWYTIYLRQRSGPFTMDIFWGKESLYGSMKYYGKVNGRQSLWRDDIYEKLEDEEKAIQLALDFFEKCEYLPKKEK